MKWANFPWELATLTRCLQPATPQIEQEQHTQCLLRYYGDRFSHPLCSRAYSSYQLLSRLVLHQERLRKESGRRRAELLPALDLINFNHSVQPSIFLAAAWARCYCLKLPYSASSAGCTDPVIGQWQHTTAWYNMFDCRAGNLRLPQLTLPAQHSHLNGFMSLNLNLQQQPISGSWHYSRSILSKKNFVD